MRTVQMTLDDELVAAVDTLVDELRTNRSAFTRDALHAALARHRTKRLEQKHRHGYLTQPVAADEFSDWESEHAWGEE